MQPTLPQLYVHPVWSPSKPLEPRAEMAILEFAMMSSFVISLFLCSLDFDALVLVACVYSVNWKKKKMKNTHILAHFWWKSVWLFDFKKHNEKIYRTRTGRGGGGGDVDRAAFLGGMGLQRKSSPELPLVSLDSLACLDGCRWTGFRRKSSPELPLVSLDDDSAMAKSMKISNTHEKSTVL